MSSSTASIQSASNLPISEAIALDTSALVAIVLGEPERELYLRRMLQSKEVYISTVTMLEARIVIRNRMQMAGWVMLTRLLEHPRFKMVAPNMNDIQIASDAFLIYGKGSGHPAQLNFGDLFSYALAKSRNIPLLYKGDDFAQTDVLSALAGIS